MTTNGESKFSYLLVGLGLGAIGGLMAAILGRKETREVLRERWGHRDVAVPVLDKASDERRRWPLQGRAVLCGDNEHQLDE